MSNLLLVCILIDTGYLEVEWVLEWVVLLEGRTCKILVSIFGHSKVLPPQRKGTLVVSTK